MSPVHEGVVLAEHHVEGGPRRLARVDMTVAAVLAEANLALGGCATTLSVADLSGCAAAIDEAYVDGEADGEAICSDGLGSAAAASGR